MRGWLTKIKNWKYIHIVILLLILFPGALLRLYRLEGSMWDYGDSGRDVLVAKHIVEHHEIFLVRPAVGGAYDFLKNSPLYYYILAFFWLITRSPGGIALFFSILGITSIFCIYLITSALFNKNAGLIAACLTAFSCHMTRYSRSIFQPFLFPLFLCFTLMFLIASLKKKSPLLLFLSVFFFFVSLQIHYSALLILPVFVMWSVYSFKITCWEKSEKFLLLLLFAEYSLALSLLYLFLTYQPSSSNISFNQLLFLKTIFQNNSLRSFLLNTGCNIHLIFNSLIKNDFLGNWFSIGLMFFTFGGLVLLLIKDLMKKESPSTPLLLFSFLSSILFSGLYKEKVYHYYFTPIYLIIFVSWGYLMEKVFLKKQAVLKMIVVFILTISVFRGNEEIFGDFLPYNHSKAEYVTNKIYQDFEYKKIRVLGVQDITGEMSIIKEPSFNIYAITPDDDGSWYSPLFWYFLENKVQKPLIRLTNEDNNIQPLNNKPDYLYLICDGFEEFDKSTETECLEYFLKREKVWIKEDSLVISPLNTELNAVVYRLKRV